MYVGLFQATTKSEKVLKVFLDMLKVNGKNKFSHFVYDMGLRNALAVTLFGLGLVFSLVVPLVCFVMSFIFFLGYLIDKFNLIFVYPLDFDS